MCIRDSYQHRADPNTPAEEVAATIADLIKDCLLYTSSKYVFQYVKDVEIHNAKITTKDAFWEVEMCIRDRSKIKEKS